MSEFVSPPGAGKKCNQKIDRSTLKGGLFFVILYGRIKRESRMTKTISRKWRREDAAVAPYDIGRIMAITELERKVSPTKTLIE